MRVESFLKVVSEAGHYAAVVPLVLCVILMVFVRHRDPPPDAWLLCCAFAVSFLADQVGGDLAEQGLNNWWVTYAYAPVQFGLLWVIVSQRVDVRIGGLLVLLIVAGLTTIKGPLSKPEAVTEILGGLAVGFVIRKVPNLSRYRNAVVLYCWGTVPSLVVHAVIQPPAYHFWIASHPFTADLWLGAWVLYQVVRIVALGLLTRAILSPVLTLQPGGREAWIPRH